MKIQLETIFKGKLDIDRIRRQIIELGIDGKRDIGEIIIGLALQQVLERVEKIEFSRNYYAIDDLISSAKKMLEYRYTVYDAHADSGSWQSDDFEKAFTDMALAITEIERR